MLNHYIKFLVFFQLTPNTFDHFLIDRTTDGLICDCVFVPDSFSFDVTGIDLDKRKFEVEIGNVFMFILSIYEAVVARWHKHLTVDATVVGSIPTHVIEIFNIFI